MNVIDLPGCTPEPLMGYLKALGVFRLVAEQEDPKATMHWHGGLCRLGTTLDPRTLAAFFLERYRPTPVLAPWNGGSGFYGGGSEPLEAIATSSAERLGPYRDAISTIRSVIPREKPKDERKEALLKLCRASLPDDVVSWLDTCFVLGGDGPSYFPLFGTGGNDGRLDFTNNFMQRLAEIIPFGDGEPPADSGPWLASALFADGLVTLRKSAIGQFDPGGIGGANGVQGRFEADSRVNPWDFVLMVEGALLLAGTIARRLGTNAPARAAFPFAVNSVAVGYGSATASEETSGASRDELWLPLWGRPALLAEVTYLFSEGRAQFGRHQARNAVEFALAVNLLGVSRGITAFARYGFLRRNGLSFLATPLGRMPAGPRPIARLLDDVALTSWLDRLRGACRDKDKTPARYQVALRQVDRAMFEFAGRSEQGNDAKYLLRILAALGRAERTMATGYRFCKEKGIRPLQGLSPQWLDQANDGSPEFHLAAALAGIGRTEGGKVGAVRAHLEEVEFNEKSRRFDWSPGDPSAVWSRQPLAANLAAVFLRRQMEAFREGLVGVPLQSSRLARLDDVIAFLNAETDDDLLGDLLWGLLGIHWSRAERSPVQDRPQLRRRIPAEFGIPRLLVERHALVPKRIRRSDPRPGQADERLTWRVSKDTDAAPNAEPDPDVFHRLASGRPDAVERSVTRAARRLKSCGLLIIGYRNRYRAGKPVSVASTIRPERLLAAMLFPLSGRHLERVANAVLYPPEPEG